MKHFLALATMVLLASAAWAQTDFNTNRIGINGTSTTPPDTSAGTNTSVDRSAAPASAVTGTTNGTSTRQGSAVTSQGGGYSIGGGNVPDARVPTVLSPNGGTSGASSAGYSLTGGNVYSVGPSSNVPASGNAVAQATSSTTGVIVNGAPTSNAVGTPPMTAGSTAVGTPEAPAATAAAPAPAGTTSSGNSGTSTTVTPTPGAMLGVPPATGVVTPAASGVSATTYDQTVGGQRTLSNTAVGAPVRFSESTTPGWSLMSAAERKVYSDRARSFRSVGECRSYNQLHTSEMQTRAAARKRSLVAATVDPCGAVAQSSGRQ
jgi:hypothetical protein